MRLDGIGHDFVKSHAVNARFGKLGLQAVQIAVAFHRRAARNDNQRLLARQRKFGQIVKFPSAKDESRGDIEAEFHFAAHGCLGCLRTPDGEESSVNN